MRTEHVTKRGIGMVLGLVVLAGALTSPLSAQTAQTGTGSTGSSAPDNAAPADRPGEGPAALAEERKANRMIDQAVELLGMKSEQARGEKMLAQVPRMFPEARARFRSWLILGKHLVDNRKYTEAIAGLKQVIAGADAMEHRAEALYLTGIAYYKQGNYDQAFMVLRRVTNEFPWSVFANESYYYVGLCHFNQKNWAKAVEALRMVGTSVPALDAETTSRVEAGQRFFIKVKDKDLVVLVKKGEDIKVNVTTQHGDKESVVLEVLGQTGDRYVGSIPSEAGTPKPGNGVLETLGGETAEVVYTDDNTADKTRHVQRLGKVAFVSTASMAFMQGDFRNVVDRIPFDQPAFLQLKDLDLDVTDQPDTVPLKVAVQYKEEKKEDLNKSGIELDKEDEVWIERSSVLLTPTETAAHSGVFRGTFLPLLDDQKETAVVSPAGAVQVRARRGDRLVVQVVDRHHIHGEESRDVEVVAPVIVGQIPSPIAPDDQVSDPSLKARKLLLEAQIFLEWGRIFKDVGLAKLAAEKSEEGLARVDTILAIYASLAFERELMEGAFKTKWELLLLQDKILDAIGVCQQLVRLFPDTPYAGQAFLQIGRIHLESEQYQEAIGIFNRTMTLTDPDIKAEAQYHIGLAMEAEALSRAKASGSPADLAGAMTAYRNCADGYPDSPFAGQALGKVVRYYEQSKDYARAISTVQLILQDYPDAGWLDEVLLVGGAAAYRAGNLPLAGEWFGKIVAEYSQGQAAAKAAKFLAAVERKQGEE